MLKNMSRKYARIKISVFNNQPDKRALDVLRVSYFRLNETSCAKIIRTVRVRIHANQFERRTTYHCELAADLRGAICNLARFKCANLTPNKLPSSLTERPHKTYNQPHGQS
jgi:hypothetical protein